MMVTNKTEFAKLIGYSSRQVSAWVDQGMPVEKGGGKGIPLEIDSAKAVRWLLGKRGSGASRQTALSEERKRLTSAQAEKVEIENAVRNGELLEISDVEILILETTALLVGQLSSLGSRLAGELAGLSNPKTVLKRINAETDRLRRDIAKKFREGAARADS